VLIPSDSLGGTVALVTGAGSGIGKATALQLAQAGARVAALSRSGDELERTCHEITERGGECIPITASIDDAGAMQSAVNRVEQAWGRLDIVVANAGINGVWAPIEELEPDDWDKTMNVNLRGTFLTIRSAARLLKVRGGSVVVVSSVNGTRMFSNSGTTAYSVTKAGQVAMARMLALELAQHKVRVNTVCPGAITTNIDESTERKDLERIKPAVEFPEGQIPLTRGKPGTAEQVAQLIWFLCSDAARHITGTEVFIDGGQSLLQG
jgi:NAD(P)-dependent dehydrogenase (short-subunit alcohol dehydrogenase family)